MTTQHEFLPTFYNCCEVRNHCLLLYMRFGREVMRIGIVGYQRVDAYMFLVSFTSSALEVLNDLFCVRVSRDRISKARHIIWSSSARSWTNDCRWLPLLVWDCKKVARHACMSIWAAGANWFIYVISDIQKDRPHWWQPLRREMFNLWRFARWMAKLFMWGTCMFKCWRRLLDIER